MFTLNIKARIWIAFLDPFHSSFLSSSTYSSLYQPYYYCLVFMRKKGRVKSFFLVKQEWLNVSTTQTGLLCLSVCLSCQQYDLSDKQ